MVRASRAWTCRRAARSAGASCGRSYKLKPAGRWQGPRRLRSRFDTELALFPKVAIPAAHVGAEAEVLRKCAGGGLELEET